MIKKIWRLIYLVFGFIVYWLCSIVPVKRNLWIFGSWEGTSYSDNTKFFFEYINKKKHTIKPVWLSKNKNTIKYIKNLSYKAYHTNSLAGIYYASRAEFAFSTSFIQNVMNPLYISKKTKLVNLWHGTPLKVLGDDHNRNTETGKLKKAKHGRIFILKSKLWKILFPFIERKDDYFMSPSPEAMKRLSSAFPGHNKTIHFSCPYPRNEVFLKNNRESSSARKVIYMPTWRSYKGNSIDLFSEYGFDPVSINNFLNKNNITLDLKLHKYSKIDPYIRSEIEKSDKISILEIEDIYNVINQYDLLITDFSSIYFDFLYTQRPIIFAPFDLEEYIENDHKLYYPYDSVTPGPKARNWSEIISLLEKFIINPELHSSERKEIHNTFNPVQSGSFNETLYTKIMEMRLEK